MKLNLNSLEDAYKNASKENSFEQTQKVEWLKIKNGDNFYHILPPVNSELPFHEIYVHFIHDENGSPFAYQCSKKFERKCAICEQYYNLKDSPHQQDNKLAQSIRPQRKFLYNAYEQKSGSDTTGKLGILSVGPKCHQEILFQIKEDVAAGFDPCDYKQGVVIKVVRTGKNLETVYKAVALRNRNTLPDDIIASLNDEGTLLDLSKIYDVFTNAELIQVLNGNFDPKGKFKKEEKPSVAEPVAQVKAEPLETARLPQISSLTPEQLQELMKMVQPTVSSAEK